MRGLMRIFCAVVVACTLAFGATLISAGAPTPVVMAQEEGATPPADIEPPPDQVETSEGFDWGLLGLLGLLGLAGLLRRPGPPTRTVEHAVEQPPVIERENPRQPNRP